MREMYEVSALKNTSGFFQMSSSIDNVKHIFVYLQRAKSNNPLSNRMKWIHLILMTIEIMPVL